MKIALAVDNTVPLHMVSFIDFFKQHSKKIECHILKSGFHFEETEIEYERVVRGLRQQIRKEVNNFDATFLITAVPYSNNYFYVGLDKLYLISLSDWHLLTTLPMSNGIAYMLCQIILKYFMGIGQNHETKTGCINDFWWDKTGIDVGMRAAFICDRCRSKSQDNPYIYSQEFLELVAVLNAISNASRRGVDILLEPVVVETTNLATFLCHNSQDKPSVRLLNRALTDANVKTWFDEESIEPGEIWQDKLEATIASIGSCLVIVGDSGSGPWQSAERRAFIDEFAKRGCRIIPVLIGTSSGMPELPIFLRQFMWVDLRRDDGRQLTRLISALKPS